MEKSNFNITGRSVEQGIILEAEGYIIYDTAGQFEKAITDSFQDDPKSITIDMEKVVVFTSVGIRVILKVYKAAKERNVELYIENPSDIVKDVLKLSSLDEMLIKED